MMGVAPRATTVVMAAAGPRASGSCAGIFLAHVMGNHGLGAAIVVVAIRFGVDLLSLGHRGQGDERKSRSGDQESSGDHVCFSG